MNGNPAHLILPMKRSQPEVMLDVTEGIQRRTREMEIDQNQNQTQQNGYYIPRIIIPISYRNLSVSDNEKEELKVFTDNNPGDFDSDEY